MTSNEIITQIKKELPANMPKAVYFIGCGGSMAAMYSAFYLLRAEALNIASYIYTSNEFVHQTPKSLGGDCICIICSLKGTAETVEAAKKANTAGAITIAMSGGYDTPMAMAGKYCVTYTKWSNSNQVNSLKLVFEMLREFEGYKHYNEAMDCCGKIEGIIQAGLDKNAGIAKRFAEECKDSDVFYILASGSLWASAYTMASCHLMEMQWKHAVTVHSGEYFHGTFETTDKNVPIILMMGCGKTRALDERAKSFVTKYSDRVYIVDTEEFGVQALGPNVAEYFNSAVMVPIERDMVCQMSIATGHPMEKRRYMWQFEY